MRYIYINNFELTSSGELYLYTQDNIFEYLLSEYYSFKNLIKINKVMNSITFYDINSNLQKTYHFPDTQLFNNLLNKINNFFKIEN